MANMLWFRYGKGKIKVRIRQLKHLVKVKKSGRVRVRVWSFPIYSLFYKPYIGNSE